MSNKPVIEVDVNDQQFRAFYELFQQYSTQVEEMPDDWKKVSGATKDAGKFASDFAKYSDTSKEALMLAAIQADAIGKSVGEAIKAQKEFASVARNGSSELEKMAKHAKTLGSEVFGIGKFLMKIGTIGFGLTGVGAILSGLGLRDLARSAISTQGEARSIGVSTGQLSAFETDFGRYVDPSILNRAADAQSDMRKIPYAMLATGQSLSAIQNQSPDELSLRMMQRAHDWYTNTPVAARNAQTLRGTGLDQFMSFEEVRKLGAMTPQEFGEARDNYRKDAKSFNVSDKSTDAWFGFERELEAAGKLLKSELTDKLSELAPNLKDFVRGLGDDAKILIDDVLSPDNLRKAGDALHDFATWLGSDEFRKEIKQFGDTITALVADTNNLAQFIHKMLHPFGGDTPDDQKDKPSLMADVGTGGLGEPVFGGGDATAANARMAKLASSINGGSSKGAKSVWGWMMDYLGGKDNAAIAGHIARSGSDMETALSTGMSDVVMTQAMVESGGHPNAVGPMTKSGQAKGLLQFTDDTAKMLGLKNAFDPVQSIGAAVRYDNQLMKKYGGDIRKTLAAYNWGPGNLDRDIAKNGNQWESHLPPETRNYINKITSALAQRSTVNLKVDVRNSTAARVAVSTNAAATGS